MEKILTAEELILERLYVTQDGIDDVHDSVSSVAEAMKEFAKLHVEAALKEASEKGKCSNGTSVVIKDSILNSYSLDNIE